MRQVRVTLTCEQYATVEFDAPDGADRATLLRLALEQLDESGGAQWRTEVANVEGITWIPEGDAAHDAR